MESDHLNLGVTLLPKFGMGSQIPQVLFHLVRQPLKTLLIPGGGNSSRFGICNVQQYTGSETINHFINTDAAS
jgi:hypothetical protein